MTEPEPSPTVTPSAVILARHRDVTGRALRTETDSARGDERTMRELAGRIPYDGVARPLFAPGEDGAWAAHHLADARTRRHTEAGAVRAALEQGDDDD
jgi:hypothetical protein